MQALVSGTAAPYARLDEVDEPEVRSDQPECWSGPRPTAAVRRPARGSSG